MAWMAGASSLDEFWDILESGKVMCQDLPSDRFPDAVFERRAFPKSFKANVLEDVDAFDHKFFKVSSREAAFMDPQQRLALQVTYQALESAGYYSSGTPPNNRNVGVYLGACTNEYYDNVCTHTPSAFSLTGSIRPFIAGKLSHYFGWTGPAIMYDTACAASGAAVHQACQAIATGEVSEAVAGGVNIFVSPETFQNLAAGHFISRTGLSKTFDESADGYCRGEGVAMVTLKRLSAALRDGDRIRGVIAGTAVGQNANEASITVPHGPSQMSLYRKALRAARLDPGEISYVEAHGTGTPVGDPIEVESIRTVFGNLHRKENDSTYLGALKSNIGHTESTSGVSGLIKVLLMMEKKTIPRQAFFNKLNPTIRPFGLDGIQIPLENVPWNTAYKAACVNNYGASGSNAVMIVTEPPTRGGVLRDIPYSESDARYPVFIAAFSASSLTAYVSMLLKFINSIKSNNNSIADIAYHLSRRKNPALPFSLCTTISSLDELKSLCESAATLQVKQSTSKARPVVLLFGGQTGKSVHAPKAFYESCTVFREHLHACDNIIRSLGMKSILPDIFDSRPHDDIIKLHTILFCVQYCNAMSWLDCGLKPSRLIGHSFGQLTALCVAGVLSLRDGLRFVSTSARYIRDQWGNDSGSMLAIETDFPTVLRILSQYADLGLAIACHNGPQSVVVAGPTSSVQLLETSLQSGAQRYKRLEVTNAFHSVLCDPILDPLRDMAKQLNFHDAELVLEPCSKEHNWKKVTPELLALHTREPVYFTQAVDRIDDQLGPCVWLEVGSESALPILRRALGIRASSHHLKSLGHGSVKPVTALSELTADLWGLGIQTQYWPFHHDQQRQYGVLNLPPYQFDKFRHWMDQIEAPTITDSRDRDHNPNDPLKLIKQTEHSSEFQINTKCSDWNAACFDNKICGLPHCPLSFILALVLKGIVMRQSDSKVGLANMVMRQYKAQGRIPSHQKKPLILEITNHGRDRSFAIANISNESRSTHVSGIISVSTSENGFKDKFRHFQALLDVPNMKRLFADPKADSVRGRGVYHSLASSIQISTKRRNVTEVSHKGSECVAYLCPRSNELSLILEDFIQVPLICLNGLKEREDNEIYINTAIGSADFHYPIPQCSILGNSLLVFSKFTHESRGKATCHMFIWDEQSDRLCAAILDAEFTNVNVGSLVDIWIEPTKQTESATRPEDLAVNIESSRDVREDLTNYSPTSSHDEKQTMSLVKGDFQKPRSSKSQGHGGSVPSANIPNTIQTLYNLLAIVADLDTTSIHADLPISDLGIDSLMAIEIASEIQNAFAISISFQEFSGLDNVGNLCRFIEDKTSAFRHEATDTTNEPGALTPLQASDKTDYALSTPGDSNTIYPSTHSGSETVFESTLDVPQAFEPVRRTFDALARETGCGGFWSNVYPAQNSLVLAYIVEALSRFHCDITTLAQGDEINVPLSLKKRLMRRFMCILRDEGFLEEIDKGWVRTGMPITHRLPSTAQFEKILSDFPLFACEHRLLHVVGSRLHACLSGELDPVSLLLGQQENHKLMADQYLLAPIQSTVSRQLADFIDQYFGPNPLHRTLRILEIGGGTCGTTLYAIDAFSKLGIPVEYTFTDISQSFVSAAKGKLRDHRFVVFRTLDVTQIPPSDLQRQFDMVIATNVIHATPNVRDSVGNVRQMLRSGGVLTLLEYTRRLPMLDVVFGQFDGWWAFNDGRDHPIIDVHEWKVALMQAGFASVEWSEDNSADSKVLRLILAY
jgi:acyl transferase domain-containing protein/acyl carrier protein/SAM-dependent methyltransferase